MVYMDHICIRSSISGHLIYLHVLAIVNSAAMDTEVHVSFQMMVFFFFFFFSGYMPGSGLAGSYGCSLFSFPKESP